MCKVCWRTGKKSKSGPGGHPCSCDCFSVENRGESEVKGILNWCSDSTRLNLFKLLLNAASASQTEMRHQPIK